MTELWTLLYEVFQPAFVAVAALISAGYLALVIISIAVDVFSPNELKPE